MLWSWSGLGLGGLLLIDRLLDGDAAADCDRYDEQAEPDQRELEPLLVLVLRERLELPFVILSGGHLGEAGLRLGLHAGAMDGGLLHRRQFGLALLLLEGAAVALVFLGSHARGLFLLPAAHVVDAALLFFPCPPLGLGFFFFLPALRVAQDLLDRDHHRGFLPFTHVLLPRLIG